MSKEEAVFVLMDRTLKLFMTVGLIIVVGFGLLFLIAYVIDFKKRSESKMEKDNWLLEDRKFKWYDVAFPIIFGVLTLGILGIILLGQSL